MAAPKYAQRLGRLPAVLELLAQHPDGMALGALADAVGVPAPELRQDLLAFYTADPGILLGLSRGDVLEFLSPDGSEADPDTAEVVRVVDERPSDELGVERVDARELALVYAAGRALLDLEPHNTHLREALEVLTETMYGAATPLSDPGPADDHLAALRRAVEERRPVRITYSRAWSAGVSDRTIDPYRVVQTRRGWEVDAGPPDDQGRLRTFLLTGLRALEVLDDTFEPPTDLDRRLADQRTTATVRVTLPHAARWAADFFTEDVTVVEDDDYTSTLDLALLPPVDQRIGHLLLAAGEEARVQRPARLIASGPALASELLEHHRGV